VKVDPPEDGRFSFNWVDSAEREFSATTKALPDFGGFGFVLEGVVSNISSLTEEREDGINLF
jgi:hypothetical protein